jgi:ribosomal protein S18 acetylase RimI-like enzyme
MAIRPLDHPDQPILWEMLYHAIYVPVGQAPPPRVILGTPDIAPYAANWGRRGDLGFLAIEDGTPFGAAWLRLMHGYGYVADDIPELSIAVLPDHRGRGVGTILLTALIESAKKIYPGISLSVSEDNPAQRLYERFDFQTVGFDGNSIIMMKRFAK